MVGSGVNIHPHPLKEVTHPALKVKFLLYMYGLHLNFQMALESLFCIYVMLKMLFRRKTIETL